MLPIIFLYRTVCKGDIRHLHQYRQGLLEASSVLVELWKRYFAKVLSTSASSFIPFSVLVRVLAKISQEMSSSFWSSQGNVQIRKQI